MPTQAGSASGSGAGQDPSAVHEADWAEPSPEDDAPQGSAPQDAAATTGDQDDAARVQPADSISARTKHKGKKHKKTGKDAKGEQVASDPEDSDSVTEGKPATGKDAKSKHKKDKHKKHKKDKHKKAKDEKHKKGKHEKDKPKKDKGEKSKVKDKKQEKGRPEGEKVTSKKHKGKKHKDKEHKNKKHPEDDDRAQSTGASDAAPKADETVGEAATQPETGVVEAASPDALEASEGEAGLDQNQAEAAPDSDNLADVAEPTEPTDPTEPTEPAEPAEPAEPTGPTGPTDPVVAAEDEAQDTEAQDTPEDDTPEDDPVDQAADESVPVEAAEASEPVRVVERTDDPRMGDPEPAEQAPHAADPDEVADLLRVGPGFELSAVDTSSTPGFEAGKHSKHAAEKATEAAGAELAEWQERLYAEAKAGGRRALLLIVQGMDTAGKGGIMRHVVGAMDPQGVRITAFKAPTEEERSKGYLWRIRQALPAAGQVGVFDRSQYEDVLIARVRHLVPRSSWVRRYQSINTFERQTVAKGTTIVKVMLHISEREQRQRLAERIERPDKHWKHNPGDIDERAFWPEYQDAYADALTKCSTDDAPWYVVPADHKWYARWAVSQLLLVGFRQMDPQWPAADFDLGEEAARLAAT
ncbi:MAG: PPK2 family polyphosphate kinase [Actinomycetales bacterium]